MEKVLINKAAGNSVRIAPASPNTTKEAATDIKVNTDIAVDTSTANEDLAVEGNTDVADEEVIVTDEMDASDEAALSGDVLVDDMAVSDSVNLEEAASDDILLADGAYVKPGMDGGFIDPGYTEGTLDPAMGNTVVKDPLLSSWIFVAGISAAVLFVSVALGAFLARRKIKKGIELYED
ncbi:MAG: putative rane protein [Herbinix sp.]|nr:putative rane protein [Herbinix sp.]